MYIFGATQGGHVQQELWARWSLCYNAAKYGNSKATVADSGEIALFMDDNGRFVMTEKRNWLSVFSFPYYYTERIEDLQSYTFPNSIMNNGDSASPRRLNKVRVPTVEQLKGRIADSYWKSRLEHFNCG